MEGGEAGVGFGEGLRGGRHFMWVLLFLRVW